MDSRINQQKGNTDTCARGTLMRVVKWSIMLISVIVINIILLSPALIGLSVGENKLETAFVVTIWIVSAIVVMAGSYAYLLREKPKLYIRELQNEDDYREHLLLYRNNKVIHREVEIGLDQFTRMDRRKAALQGVLQERFTPTELSYQRFAAVIVGVEKLFQLNMKGMLNKLHAFEASDISNYANQPRNQMFSNRLHQQKAELFQQYMQNIQGYLNSNEEILLKLDQLLLEISRLGSADYKDIEELACIKDIDALIKQTKYYQ